MEEDPDDNTWLEAEAPMEQYPITVLLGPMGSVFQQLRSAISWQYGRLKGVKTEIQILGQGLEGLCTDLTDLSEAKDAITRCWVRQVRDLCYDTSDYLDELSYFIHYSSRNRPRTRLFLEHRLGSRVFSVSHRPACNHLRLPLPKVRRLKRVRLIAKLSALIARVEDADERRRRFHISPPHYAQAAGVSHRMPQLPLQLHVDNLIKLLGFDHDNHERNLEVVTIFGYAGVGKRAVARTLYHKYREKFQYRGFLRVSRHPDTRRLFADLLSQIKAQPAHAFSDVEAHIATSNKHLQGKSYLIVIDDLWDTSTWDIIRRALPDGYYCRIIITTQIEGVALACCGDQLRHIYAITPLSNDQSGISVGGCTEGMKEALNLVYNYLPPHLKTCLLYLNIYPEGWTVKKGELVKQWVAEGFIHSVQGQDTEETAGCYFDALVSKGMVQVVDTNHNGEVLSCTLHHMVLDLIRQESMEENFVTIVNYFQTILGLPDKVRRLSVQLGGAKGANNIAGNMRISQVRSLIYCGFFRSVPSIIEYGLLHVLILHIWSDQDRIFDLTTIGELYGLQYLKIECSITVKLPHKIRRLQQLGTLQVDARLYAVPSDIVHLEKLLHLCLQSESLLPHGVGRMTCLRTLGYFDIGCNSEDNVRDLGELKNLQDLQLTCSIVEPAECLEKNVQLLLGSVLKKLSALQSVTLVPATGSSDINTLQEGAAAASMIISCDGSSSVSPAPADLKRLELSRHCCIFSRLPKWLGELSQLSILKIAVGELSKEDIGILNGLSALATLSLHVQPMSAERIVFGKGGFSVLTYFKIACTVRRLEFEAHAMPNLKKLKLCFNSPRVDEQGNTRIIIIERLLGLKEISAIIGSAGVDAESAWRKAIKSDPGNPAVQLMGWIYSDSQGRGMVTCEGSGEHENNEGDIRVHMPLESSCLPVPEHSREDQPIIQEKISIPSESESTNAQTAQIPAMTKALTCYLSRAPRSSLGRPLVDQNQPPRYKLMFRNGLSKVVFTRKSICAANGDPVKICLESNQQGSSSSRLVSTKIKIVVLDGDFNRDSEDCWTSEDFREHIVHPRDKVGAVLTGELDLTLKNGEADLRDATFIDNSRFVRSGMFRLGVMTVDDLGERVLEGITEPFTVKDRRGEGSQKHIIPTLDDDVWRLKKISKDGVFHEALKRSNIFSVKDFLRSYYKDEHSLRRILTKATKLVWATIVDHAKMCDPGKELYSFVLEDYSVVLFFNSVYQIIGGTIDDQYTCFHDLDKPMQDQVREWSRVAYDTLPSRQPDYDMDNGKPRPVSQSISKGSMMLEPNFLQANQHKRKFQETDDEQSTSGSHSEQCTFKRLGSIGQTSHDEKLEGFLPFKYGYLPDASPGASAEPRQSPPISPMLFRVPSYEARDSPPRSLL